MHVEYKTLGSYNTIEFSQSNCSVRESEKFDAASMSDGTLRALGILAALNIRNQGRTELPLIAIEEPELSLHPAAAGMIRHAMMDASHDVQLLVSTHSP